MHLDPFVEALALVALGVGVSLIGRHIRRLYFRDVADNPRARDAPDYELMNAGMRRGAVIFLTAGVMLVLLGIGVAGREVLRLLGF